MENIIIKNFSLLKKMEKAGHITLHPQTGSKITTLYSKQKMTCCYIDDGKGCFKFQGMKYHTRYFSGCFFPFVVANNNPEKSHIILAL